MVTSMGTQSYCNNSNLTHFMIDLAGIKVRIETPTSSTYAYCIKFLSSGDPDIEVHVTKDDIQREVDAASANMELTYVNKPYLETVAAYRMIVNQVSDYGLFLMHGAAIAVNDNAYLFSAPSGTGKTTHIRHWLAKAKNADVINGDKPLIKVTETGIYACGTPWCGKERLGKNATVPLKGIVFLERSSENHMEQISYAEAYPLLLRHVYIPSDLDRAKKTLNLLTYLSEYVSFWRFKCNNFKDDCFHVAYHALCE